MYLFCYGTLKRGDVRNDLLRSARFVGTARVPGHTLYSCGSYPAMIESEVGSVSGELYEVDESLLDRTLDSVEDRPYLYDRRVVPVEPAVEGITEAITYIYQRDTSRLELLGENWITAKERRSEAGAGRG